MFSASQFLKSFAPKNASTPVGRKHYSYRFDDSSDDEQIVTDPKKIARGPSRKKTRYDPYQVQDYRNGEVIQNRGSSDDATTHLLSNVRNTFVSKDGDLFEKSVYTFNTQPASCSHTNTNVHSSHENPKSQIIPDLPAEPDFHMIPETAITTDSQTTQRDDGIPETQVNPTPSTPSTTVPKSSKKQKTISLDC